MKAIELTWECNKCGDIVKSYSHKRWDMNHCKCGHSAVDLEEWYQRNVGSITEIERKEIDI